jgi:predicted HTH transcriptional regulator
MFHTPTDLLRFEEQAVPETSVKDLNERLWRRLLGPLALNPVEALHKAKLLTRDGSVRILQFDDRCEIYSPGALPNSLTIDSLPFRQSTRNELVTSLLARCRVEAPGADVRRQFLMEKRGDGVPVILRESLELSGREPEYRLFDGEELLLTIWAAKPPDPDSV